MCNVLNILGAQVSGYSLEPPTMPNMFTISDVQSFTDTHTADIRDLSSLSDAVLNFKPDIIIHMAAQPLVSVGYSNPVLTYSSNVMGTVNVLETVRHCGSVKSVVNVTTDKVYYNKEWCWGYRESELLNGYDPYSNSKSCAELVTSCYRSSFLKDKVAVSTARAGNVIGGGDFTNPRIIPDCVRSVIDNKTMVLRNPTSTRPYQHVLEPIFAYLMIAAKQYTDHSLADSYNVGPADEGSVTNETLVKLFGNYWGTDFQYKIKQNLGDPHEANYLRLDCSKIKAILDWSPKWTVEQAVEKTVEWTKAYLNGNPNECMSSQIEEYLKDLKW